jgi:hypothetical protein
MRRKNQVIRKTRVLMGLSANQNAGISSDRRNPGNNRDVLRFSGSSKPQTSAKRPHFGAHRNTTLQLCGELAAYFLISYLFEIVFQKKDLFLRYREEKCLLKQNEIQNQPCSAVHTHLVIRKRDDSLGCGGVEAAPRVVALDARIAW